jgi:predicted SprT family Zn-dependent metalloprotease
MKPERQVLTAEMKKRVSDRVKECLAIAAKKYPEHQWPMPEIAYDVHSWTAGMAYGNDWRIRLNAVMFFENEKDFLHNTVGHEVAHLIQRKVYGVTKIVQEKGKDVIKKVRSHGPEWKECMALLNLKPDVTHRYSVASLPKKKRRRRGSMLAESEAQDMLRRLQTGFRRLPDVGKDAFIAWAEAHRKGDEP